MSKIPELMGGRKLEHSANIIGSITTQRDVVAAPAAKVGGQILSAQSISLTAASETLLSSVELPAAPSTVGNLGSGAPVGTLRAGTIIRVTVIGRNSNSAGTVNLTLNVKLGATTGGFAAATAVGSFVGDPSPNHYVYLTSEIHVVSVGGSGAVLSANRSFANGAGGTPIVEATTFGGASVSTLVSNTLYVTGQWASAPGETFSVNDISVEIIGG